MLFGHYLFSFVKQVSQSHDFSNLQSPVSMSFDVFSHLMSSGKQSEHDFSLQDITKEVHNDEVCHSNTCMHLSV